MHVTVTRVSTGEVPIETATMVGEEMERWLRDMEGFEGFLLVSRPGASLGLTFWTSRDVADRHRATRVAMVERMTGIAGVEVEDVLDYEIAYARLGPRVLEG